jgi:membrane-associated phospholipid phosphatase
MIQEHAPE